MASLLVGTKAEWPDTEATGLFRTVPELECASLEGASGDIDVDGLAAARDPRLRKGDQRDRGKESDAGGQFPHQAADAED
jgi:hypothetical protein